jgi:hypothetical protein
MAGNVSPTLHLAPPPSPRWRRFTPPPTLALTEVQNSIELAEDWSKRFRNRQVRLRRRFVWRRLATESDPAAIRLLRRSETALKLGLSLYWASGGEGQRKGYEYSDRELRTLDERRRLGPRKAGKPIVVDEVEGKARLVGTDPHTTDFTYEQWATLLGRSEAGDVAASAAVRRAMVTLAREGLVLADLFQGSKTRLQLGLESGTPGQFKTYRKPAREKPKVGAFDDADVWMLLPPELWTNGWIAALSGRALITYLVIARQSEIQKPAFLTDEVRIKHFGIADEEVIGEGAAELDFYEIIRRRAGRYARLEFEIEPDAFRRDAVDVLKAVGKTRRVAAVKKTGTKRAAATKKAGATKVTKRSASRR